MIVAKEKKDKEGERKEESEGERKVSRDSNSIMGVRVILRKVLGAIITPIQTNTHLLLLALIPAVVAVVSGAVDGGDDDGVSSWSLSFPTHSSNSEAMPPSDPPVLLRPLPPVLVLVLPLIPVPTPVSLPPRVLVPVPTPTPVLVIESVIESVPMM